MYNFNVSVSVLVEFYIDAVLLQYVIHVFSLLLNGFSNESLSCHCYAA